MSKFVTREYVKINSLSNTYNENKSIRFKTPMLRSDLCDYADAYILVNGTFTVAGNHPTDRQNRPVILKNNAPFISCITKINGELIKDAEDLDIVMPMYNLLEYSKNYRKTVGSLYNYYRDELSDDNDVVNSNAFQYKNRFIGNTYNVDSTIAGGAADDPRLPNPNYDANRSGKKDNRSSQQIVNLDGGDTTAPTDATLAINDCKLYVPVVTLSKNDEIKLLTNLKSGFKREIIWNKYRSQMSTGEANDNLNILIDPTFTNVNRLFVLPYQAASNRQILFTKSYG